MVYGTYCTICHGGPVNPGLPRSQHAADAKAWNAVVIGGALADNGMISFKPYLTAEQAEAVRAFVLKLGNDGAAAGAPLTSQKDGSAWPAAISASAQPITMITRAISTGSWAACWA